MKKLVLWFLVLAFFGGTSSSQAALIDLGMTSYGDEPRIYEIYNALYGKSYADNDAIEFLENDFFIANGLFTSSAGKILFAARYASAPLGLAYYDTAGTHFITGLPANQIMYNPPTISFTVGQDEPFGMWGWSSYGRWFSDYLLNSDGEYHFLVLNTPEPNKLLICFEDMSAGGDWDYNDFVFELEYYVIPEPASLLLLGIGLLGMAGVRANKKKRNKVDV